MPKDYITEKGLKCLKWKYVRRITKNCEIWRNGDSKLMWNRVTLRFYMILKKQHLKIGSETLTK